MKMETKKRWGNNTYIRKNTPQNKAHNKRQRRSLRNTKGIDLTRGYNPCKHICTQYGSIYIGYNQIQYSNTTILGDFNTLLPSMDRSSR